MWCLPSRGRPESVVRFFKAWRETGASTPGVLWLDEDDAQKYQGIELPEKWRVTIWPRCESLGATINKFYEMFKSEPWFGMLADDAVPVTSGWDVALIKSAANDGISYCADGINDEKQVGHCVIGGDLARELGWLILPGLTRVYGDNVLTEIGRRKGVLRYLPDVLVEHWHFSTGKSPYDETYAKPYADRDRMIYERWLSRYRMGGPIAVACVQVGNYAGHGERYVRTLKRAVYKHLTIPHEFYCITDEPIDGVNCIAADPELKGWWQKLYLFKGGHFKEDRALFFDLDTFIVGNIDHLASYQGDLAMLGDFWTSNLIASGVMAWNPRKTAYLWERYESQGKPQPDDGVLGDRWWIQQNCDTCDILQHHFPGTLASYKGECVQSVPRGVSVCCFHGKPRPHEAKGWAKNEWNRLKVAA